MWMDGGSGERSRRTALDRELACMPGSDGEVLRGGTLRPMSELHKGVGSGGGEGSPTAASDEASEVEVAFTDVWKLQDLSSTSA
ncbi:hypothetical protein TIFTF001_044136 [Ficus carica]|uniref:Uncharacterized protein n=1 Tax=Ficus carica TaxID=3494 RepID=A0AA87ZJC1_FICCA|nr:hypothetical protein TIFTF001_044136 [Ficus carica]